MNPRIHNRHSQPAKDNQDIPLIRMDGVPDNSLDEENVDPAAAPADINAKNQPIIQNAKKNLNRYRKLVKYYESQIIIASEQLNRTEETKIREASKQLKAQLEIYQAHLKDQLQKHSFFYDFNKKLGKDRYPIIHHINNGLDNLYHRSEENDLKIVNESLNSLNRILARPERKDLLIRKFSHESEIIKKADIEAKLKEYLAKGILDLNNLPAANGNLNADPITSIKEFCDEARINRINFAFQGPDGNPVSVNVVSVQQTEKGHYSSRFYMSHSLDGFPRQWHFGYTLPNDIYLKIAIAEVQNWLAGHPDLHGKNRIHIIGNLSAELVEAFILYCEHKGYPYSNDTIHDIKLSSCQLSGYNSQLNGNPDTYLTREKTDNKAILANGKEIEKCYQEAIIDKAPIEAEIKRIRSI